MKKILSLILSIALTTSLLVGCEKSKPSSQEVSVQLTTIDNFNKKITYKKVPERSVVLSYNVAEIMTALELEDKIVSLAPGMYTLDNVLPQYRDKIKNISLLEGLTNGVPNLESVLKVNPDFVYGTSYNFSPKNCGDTKDYEKNGVNIYASEATYTNNATLENTYNDILNIGKIFNVEDRAKKLIEDLKKEESSIKEKTSDLKPVKVFAYDSGEDKPFTIGGMGLENNLITLAGGENIFNNIDKHYTEISWENLIDKNPDVIIIYEYYTNNDGKKKIDFLKSKKELSEISAIKNNRFIVVSSFSVFPSLQNIDAIKTIAKGLHPDKF